MEIMNAEDTSKPHASLSTKRSDSPLLVSCNWQISSNKQFVDTITTAPMRHAPERIHCEDVVVLDTCIALQPVGSGTDSSIEPCVLDIKMTNCQMIARIAVVSEGNVLEIFKQFGEYETTILAEFIDEYEKNVVFLGETTIHPPTTEVSIKFIRTKNKGPPMWIYGIRLFLMDSTEEAKSSAFDYNVIQSFFGNVSNGKMSQRSEITKRLFEFYDEPGIMNKEKILEELASSTRYDKYINEIRRSDNGKKIPNFGDDYEQSNASECKNGIVTRNGEIGYPNCREDCKKLDASIETCADNKTESIKEAKSSAFNDDEDFIQTFISNARNGRMSQDSKTTISFGNNREEFEQFRQEISELLASDSDHSEHKNDIANRKEHRRYNLELDFFDSKNKNARDDGKDCEGHKKSDIDIRIYIDNKFQDMEKRLMERIDEMEASTNQKLDAILEKLESRLNSQ